MRSLVGVDWGQSWDKFTETVGNALWGSKWYEVMIGDPWPDLEQKIASGEVKGAWPAAHDHWGSWSSKLETVFLVAVPSEANRNPARILPGRSDVYIIPRAGTLPLLYYCTTVLLWWPCTTGLLYYCTTVPRLSHRNSLCRKDRCESTCLRVQV